MDERRWERLGAVLGLVLIAVVVVAVLLTGSPPKPTDSDATVKAKIEEGGNGMPAYKDMLSDQEKEDLLAYLKTL